MVFELHRGTNISHWLSQSTRRGEERVAWFTQDDVRHIAGLGFDHIRLPFDEEQLWDEQGNLEPEALQLLESALDWCQEAGLRVVLDLHILRSHHFISREQPALFTDPEEAQRFAGLWRSLSQRLHERPTDQVAYELLNEAVAQDPAAWNRVAHTAYRALRELEPERTIVLGSNEWNSPHTYDQLEVPSGDPNLILTFHFYEPAPVTHYRAHWTPIGRYTGPVQYPGPPIPPEGLDQARAIFGELAETRGLSADQVERRFREATAPYTRASMEGSIAKPLAARAATGLPLYCGEFGCIELCPHEVRSAWYRDIVWVFKEHGIAWANWDYKGGFGIITPSGRDTGIAELLLS